MKKKTVSIKNIADHLNISVTTVSFVLNGKAKEKHISKILTQKVLDYAKEVNYKPNQIAQSLRTGKSKILVFMVEDISNYFFAKYTGAIRLYDLANNAAYSFAQVNAPIGLLAGNDGALYVLGRGDLFRISAVK